MARTNIEPNTIMKQKKRYRGDFNWYGEVHTVYLYVSSPKQVFLLMCYKLAKKLNRTAQSVYNYFYKTDRYIIYED
jgi:Leu/Phe-tRNA-protein transferase